MCVAVGKLFLFVVDVILDFLDMAGQHLQFGLLQPAECPFRFGVVLIIMGMSEGGGGSVFGSLALTRVLARFLVFLRPRQGVGILSFSCGVGLSISLISFGLMWGV